VNRGHRLLYHHHGPDHHQAFRPAVSLNVLEYQIGYLFVLLAIVLRYSLRSGHVLELQPLQALHLFLFLYVLRVTGCMPLSLYTLSLCNSVTCRESERLALQALDVLGTLFPHLVILPHSFQEHPNSRSGLG
jgi:hypothetical protein